MIDVLVIGAGPAGVVAALRAADRGAAFCLGIGGQPARAVEVATLNWRLRDAPRARDRLARAIASQERGDESVTVSA